MGQIVNDVEEILAGRQAKKEAGNERMKILDEMRRTSAEKENLIKKALAAQRAKFGAGGAAPGMSADAVMKRLKSETSEPYEEKLRAAEEKLKKIKTPKTNLLKKWLGRLETLLVG